MVEVPVSWLRERPEMLPKMLRLLTLRVLEIVPLVMVVVARVEVPVVVRAVEVTLLKLKLPWLSETGM